MKYIYIALAALIFTGCYDPDRAQQSITAFNNGEVLSCRCGNTYISNNGKWSVVKDRDRLYFYNDYGDWVPADRCKAAR